MKCVVDGLQSKAGISSFSVKQKYNDADDMWVCVCVGVYCAVKPVHQLLKKQFAHELLGIAYIRFVM